MIFPIIIFINDLSFHLFIQWDITLELWILNIFRKNISFRLGASWMAPLGLMICWRVSRPVEVITFLLDFFYFPFILFLLSSLINTPILLIEIPIKRLLIWISIVKQYFIHGISIYELIGWWGSRLFDLQLVQLLFIISCVQLIIIII